MIKSDVGYAGEIRFDPSKPDGAKHKTVDGQRGRALLRWSPEVDLRSGVRTTVRWLEENYARIVHD
jgi:GDP-L-fucose synthase